MDHNLTQSTNGKLIHVQLMDKKCMVTPILTITLTEKKITKHNISMACTLQAF